MHETKTSHRSPTAEGSNDAGEYKFARDHTDAPSGHDEDSYDDRDRGHPLIPGAQHYRMVLRERKEQWVGVKRMCKEGLAKCRIKTIPVASIIFMLSIGGLFFGLTAVTIVGMSLLTTGLMRAPRERSKTTTPRQQQPAPRRISH